MVWSACLIPLLAAIAASFFLPSKARSVVEDLLVRFPLLAAYFYSVGSHNYPCDALYRLSLLIAQQRKD
jgi:hypothetical protein